MHSICEVPLAVIEHVTHPLPNRSEMLTPRAESGRGVLISAQTHEKDAPCVHVLQNLLHVFDFVCVFVHVRTYIYIYIYLYVYTYISLTCMLCMYMYIYI